MHLQASTKWIKHQEWMCATHHIVRGEWVPKVPCHDCGRTATKSSIAHKLPFCDKCFDIENRDETRAAMIEAAADYTCELCGAQSLLKTCLDCIKHPAIDHRGIEEWNKDAGVDA